METGRALACFLHFGRCAPASDDPTPSTCGPPRSSILPRVFASSISISTIGSGSPRQPSAIATALATVTRSRRSGRRKRSGSYVFPLSAEHYMEMSGIADPRQRFDVAAVMEELSGFASLVSRTIVMRVEVEAAVDTIAHPRPEPYAAVPVLCQGVLQAFGRRGGLRIRDESGKDVTEAVRRECGGAGPSSSTCGKPTQSVNSTARLYAVPRMLRRRSCGRLVGIRPRRVGAPTNAPHRNTNKRIASRPNRAGDGAAPRRRLGPLHRRGDQRDARRSAGRTEPGA